MILVTGATGFVGRRVIARLADAGQPARALTRSRAKGAMFPPRVDVARGDVLDTDSLASAMEGVTAVVHLVAVIREVGKRTFHRVNYEGTLNVLEAAAAAGVERVLFVGAVGSGSDPDRRYLHSRWMAEREVVRSPLAHTILRFTIGFGVGDEFLNQLAALVKAAPVTPVLGDGSAVFQPIAIDDVARCVVESLARDDVIGREIDIGGPDYVTYDELIDLIAETLGVQVAKFHAPIRLMTPFAAIMEALTPHPPVTREQLSMIETSERTDLDSVERQFGFRAMPMRGNIDYIRAISLREALAMTLGFMPKRVRDH